MKTASSKSQNALEPLRVLRAFESFKPFHSIIHYYVDLSCFLIPSPDAHGWWALNRRKRPVSFAEIETQYGDARKRYRFLRDCFRKVKSGGQSVLGEKFGLGDLFVPILKKKKLLGYLQAGTFCTSELTAVSLRRGWKELTGLEASADLPEFREFTRALLETPVLEGPLLSAYRECLEVFARLLVEELDSADAQKKLFQLLNGVISKGLPHSYWMDWALGQPADEPVPYWHRWVEDWDWTRDEIGISRVPTTVLTVMPQRPAGRAADWTEDILQIYRLQRRAFRFGQTIPQTVGGKLENYGAVFVTSADPRAPRLERRRHIEAIAQRLKRFAENEVGGPVLVGVGETVAPGGSLAESYRQAVLALHLGRDSQKDILVFTDRKVPAVVGDFSQLRRTQAQLGEAFVSASPVEVEALENQFLKEALHLSFQNPFELRRHFQYALDRLVDRLDQRVGLSQTQSLQLRDKWVEALETTVTLQEMVSLFRASVAELRRSADRPALFQESRNLEKAKAYIDRKFREPLQAARLAKLAGVSLSTFSRRFKQATGLGMEAYVQNLRIAEAKKLLRSTRHPVEWIGRACGFQSVSYFIHLFKKKTGFSPEKYRKKQVFV
jgi:AraC-like DNA-binding protein